MTTCTVELLDEADLVGMAHCMAIDADAFPYPSAQFGLRAESARRWVAREEAAEGRAARVVGFLAGRVRRGAMHVEGLAVQVGARRQGVGRALVRAAVRYARSARLRSMGLHVSVINQVAIALYEGEGFHVAAKLRGFYPPRAFGGETDALEMRLRFSGG
ncbi:MAG TPA: GNAT family N-acetyltransferase [Polyangiaceae bacterium]|jgi:ribosomal protein S18 acetylase RimI-like enzyme|nr:GNAT family N-acetyltransferase [Polyangiaceae bacterium]